MKHTFVMIALAGIIGIGASSARAGKKAVETAIQSHPDLSTLSEALISTGVLDELQEDGRLQREACIF